MSSAWTYPTLWDRVAVDALGLHIDDVSVSWSDALTGQRVACVKDHDVGEVLGYVVFNSGGEVVSAFLCEVE